MRKPIALCAAFAVAAFSFVASEAAEVRIGDYVFGCKTSDGQVRKPQFGDMNGVFYTDIRGQEKACRDAVKRKIANCHQHTRFLNPGDNQKYPECLPVFQEQADECAAFFREEIAKCSGDGGGTESAANTHGVLTLQGGRYEGGVRNGKPHGRGALVYDQYGRITRLEGEWKDGELHGKMTFRDDGPEYTRRGEMMYRNGKLHGLSMEIYESKTPDGRKFSERQEIEYRDGEIHGRFVATSSEGTSLCEIYENGSKIGEC